MPVRERGFCLLTTATAEIYTLSLHDALPISVARRPAPRSPGRSCSTARATMPRPRSEEHTSELQSQFQLVCRLLLEKKKKGPTGPSAMLAIQGTATSTG